MKKKTKCRVQMGLIAIVVLLAVNTVCSFAAIEPRWTHFFSYSDKVYSGQTRSTKSFYCPGNFTLNHSQAWRNGALASNGTLKVQLCKVSGGTVTKVGAAKSLSGNGSFMPIFNVASGEYQLVFYNTSSREGERVEVSGSCMN